MVRHFAKKSKTTDCLNCPNGNQEVIDIWTQTQEFIDLKGCYTQGYVVEVTELSSYDCPYTFFTPEWLWWMSGFEKSLEKKFGTNVCV